MKKTKYKNWCVLVLLMIGLGSMILMFYYYKVREVANQERSYINIAASSEQIRDSSFFLKKQERTFRFPFPRLKKNTAFFCFQGQFLFLGRA